jgi:predicted TIM-barrel fold metal-dependent hydrolase
MALASGLQVIAIEEHYWDAELLSKLNAPEGQRSPDMLAKLHDLGEMRIAAMDAAGVDMQVLSHGAPSGQGLPPDIAVETVRAANDRLRRAIALHPKRFAGFAALPTGHPEAAADELDRCVSELGMCGAMVHGLTNGVFLDDKRFWPIFARAERLNVPIYLHPAAPHPQVMDVYYKDYVKDFPLVMRAAWGFTVEAATQAIRLVLSGVFEKHPGLQFILGHMGETLPFLLWRIDQALSRPGQAELSFRALFSEHFHITTSGHFSTPALMCVMTEMGADRIMFAIDWPFVENEPAMRWIDTLQISQADKKKMLSTNARRLLRI